MSSAATMMKIFKFKINQHTQCLYDDNDFDSGDGVDGPEDFENGDDDDDKFVDLSMSGSRG